MRMRLLAAGAGQSAALVTGDCIVTLEVAGETLTRNTRVRERIR